MAIHKPRSYAGRIAAALEAIHANTFRVAKESYAVTGEWSSAMHGEVRRFLTRYFVLVDEGVRIPRLRHNLQRAARDFCELKPILHPSNRRVYKISERRADELRQALTGNPAIGYVWRPGRIERHLDFKGTTPLGPHRWSADPESIGTYYPDD